MIFKNFHHGRKLFQHSLTVLNAHKKWSVFSILSSIFAIILLTLILIPLTPYEHLHVLTKTQWQHFLGWYVVFLIVIFLIHLIAHIFTAALMICAYDYFSQKNTGIATALNITLKRFWLIYLWTQYAGTVGIIIHLFQNYLKRFHVIQQLLHNLFWKTAIYFVVPVIMIEKSGPIKTLKRSSSLINQTWGSPVLGNFGFYSWFLLLRLLATLPFLIGFFHGGRTNLIIGWFTTASLFMIISIIHSSTKTIMMTALYLYATEKRISAPFDQKSLESAFVRY